MYSNLASVQFDFNRVQTLIVSLRRDSQLTSWRNAIQLCQSLNFLGSVFFRLGLIYIILHTLFSNQNLVQQIIVTFSHACFP